MNVFGTIDADPTMKEISELKYLDAVIKETLRLFPSVPFIGRTLKEDIKLSKTLSYVPPKLSSLFLFDIRKSITNVNLPRVGSSPGTNGRYLIVRQFFLLLRATPAVVLFCNRRKTRLNITTLRKPEPRSEEKAFQSLNTWPAVDY